jgi:hypothetical protein
MAIREGWGYELREEEYITDSTPEISQAETQRKRCETRVEFRGQVRERRDDPGWDADERHRHFREQVEIPGRHIRSWNDKTGVIGRNSAGLETERNTSGCADE